MRILAPKVAVLAALSVVFCANTFAGTFSYLSESREVSAFAAIGDSDENQGASTNDLFGVFSEDVSAAVQGLVGADASQVSSFEAFSIGAAGTASVFNDSQQGIADAASTFEAVFEVFEPTPYTLTALLNTTFANAITSVVEAAVSLVGPGGDVVSGSVTLADGSPAALNIIDFGVLAPGVYTYTAQAFANSPDAEAATASYFSTLFLPEPSSLCILLCGALALRRRKFLN
jgi:hypothetical protein